MAYDAWFYLPDTDETYPGRVYLPGEPVGDHDTHCGACGSPLDYTESVTTGAPVWRDTGTGDHDGIVGFDYDPAPGAGLMRDADLWHLRCALDSVDMGSMVVTIGKPDAMTATGHRARHAA